MKKETKEESRKRIYEAGQNDTYVEDQLTESAILWIDKNINVADEDERQEAIGIYRDGFLNN